MTGDVTQQERRTVQEVIESLTGWEELAIEKAAGSTIEQMNEGHQIHLVRSVAAVLVSRDQEIKYAEAYRAVMGMSQTDVRAMFAEDEEEPIEHDPVTESGKGGSVSVSERNGAPLSASQPVSSLPSTTA